MKFLYRIFDFYLDASIHIAFAVWALLQITGRLLQIEIDVNLSYFLFFGTIACYNFVKYGVEAKKYVLVAKVYQRYIQLASLIALGIALYHLYFLSLQTWAIIGCIALLTGLYALPILPKAQNLRSLGVLKIILVSLVWTASTVILPVMAEGELMHRDAYIETLQRFILVLILLIPFEIRDLEYDSPTLRTLPQRIGSTRTKTIGALAVILFFFLTFLKDDFRLSDAIGKGVLCLVLGITLLKTRRHQSKYFASFWVEAIPIFWWVIIEGLLLFP
ncbi:MAG: hypothetical protein MUO53_13440 [Maribacter sp.]|nr:hypothetical protein [Maribacter sp.]